MSELQTWIAARSSQKPTPMDQCPRQAEATMAIQLEHRPKWRREGRGWWTCSYCGSLAPESLWRAIHEGMELGPTDKSYKVYVKGPPVSGAGKFYFQHLTEEDQDQFIQAVNERLLNIGYPGHFYRLPFFAKLRDEGEESVE